MNMNYNKRFILLFISALLFNAIFAPVNNSYALPSFARQNSISCYYCHTIWQDLTPMGRAFKLGGYTQSANPGTWESSLPPISVGAVVSYTANNTNTTLTNGVSSPFNSPNRDTNNINLPSEFNIFYGGRIYGNLGAFIQGTYDGIGNAIVLDTVDIRYAVANLTLGDAPFLFGFTVNNRPTVEDIYNTTPFWSYPYEKSHVNGINPPTASAMVDGGLDNQVGGLGIYAMWDNSLYVDFTAYRTSYNGITKPFGANYNLNDPTGYQAVGAIAEGLTPYWRIAYEKQCGQECSMMIGTYGMVSNISPDGTIDGPTDNYFDIALDAQYQYIKPKHIITVQATWIHEYQTLTATNAAKNSSNLNNNLNTIKARVNYAYRGNSFGTIGGTLAWFNTMGTTDTKHIDYSANGSPNSNGFIAEATYLPINYIKIGLQYTLYTQFDGAATDYDGKGSNASGNNTIYLYSRLMF